MCLRQLVHDQTDVARAGISSALSQFLKNQGIASSRPLHRPCPHLQRLCKMQRCGLAFHLDSQPIAQGINFHFASGRLHASRRPENYVCCDFRPIGPVYHSAPRSLDSWLTDRYCLSAADDAGNLYRGEIDHDRWPLQPSTHPRYSNVRLARTCGVAGY
jgi:hypothetical protein